MTVLTSKLALNPRWLYTRNGSLEPACDCAGHGICCHVCCHSLQLLLCILAALEVAHEVAATQYNTNDWDNQVACSGCNTSAELTQAANRTAQDRRTSSTPTCCCLFKGRETKSDSAVVPGQVALLTATQLHQDSSSTISSPRASNSSGRMQCHRTGTIETPALQGSWPVME